MSADVQDLSLDVRNDRRLKKNRGGKEENEVDIHEDGDTLEQSHADLEFHEVRPPTQKSIDISHFAPAIILGVLLLLMVSGILARYIFATLDKQNLMVETHQLSSSLNQAQISIIDLTEERDGLQTKYTVLSKIYSQLEVERDKLRADLKATLDKQNLMMETAQLNISLNQTQTRIDSLTSEIDELQTQYNILRKMHNQLEVQREKLRAHYEDALHRTKPPPGHWSPM